jgi:DNA modification methylase
MPISRIREITTLDLDPLHQNLEFRFHQPHQGLAPTLDLNFPGVETQHATHSIHPYVAAINPPLAATLIRHYIPEGETGLDPFCGGGGVPVEAILNNRKAIGCDINPLAVLLSRVKTTHIPSRRTLKLFQKLLAEAEKETRTARVDDVPEVIRFWYFDDTLKPLRALQNLVLRIEDQDVRQLFQAVLSATARDVMLTYRGEIRLRKLQGNDLARFKPNVFVAFKKRALSAMASVDGLPQGARASVRLLDCRELTREQRCHTVITSPPYGDDKNGVGYFQFSRNMLYWIGVPLDEQKRRKESFLGSMANGVHGVPETSTLRKTLEIIGNQNPIHHREAASFYTDYYKALQRIVLVTAERVIIIIGDRVLSRTKINNGHITIEFMEAIGWRLEHYYNRQLTKKRIANLGGDGGGISLEHVMVFRQA